VFGERDAAFERREAAFERKLLDVDQRKIVPQHQPDTEMKNHFSRMLARSSVGGDLHIFFGCSKEWLAFISMYRTSTEMCGFSPAENVMRFRKCLKDQARKSVSMILIVADNDAEII
jgi:hypothetical protein